MPHIRENIRSKWFWFQLGLIVTLIWFMWPFYILSYVAQDGPGVNPSKLLDASTFGDLYGGLNTLFAGLAFVALVATLFLQSEQLRSAEEQIKNLENERQRNVFESTLYRLVDYLSQWVSRQVLTFNEKEYHGESALFLVWNSIGNQMKIAWDFDGIKSDQLANFIFGDMSSDQVDVATGYADSVILILKHIDQRGNPADQLFYLAVLRQMLSENGRRILAVVALKPRYHDLKGLMEKYGLLGNLEFEGCDPHDRIFKAFDPNAFNHSMTTLPFASRKLPDRKGN